MSSMGFLEKLTAAIEHNNSRLCVGLDPTIDGLPEGCVDAEDVAQPGPGEVGAHLSPPVVELIWWRRAARRPASVSRAPAM